MDENKQFEVLAVLDGYIVTRRNNDHSLDVLYEEGGGYHPCPDYDSHDALQRIIDGFSNEEMLAYIHALEDVLKCGVGDEWDIICMLEATPAQKREAILRATGKWEEQP